MAKMLLSKKDPDPRKELSQYVEQVIPVPPRWVDGQTVKRCGHCQDHSKKRHNCRLCGQIFCSMCSAKYHLPAKFALKNKRLPDGSVAPCRVCWGCYEDVMRHKFKVNKTKGHLVDQMMDRRKDGHIFIPIWQSVKDNPKCFRCNSTNKCRICRGCGFVFCSSSSCAVRMTSIPKAFEKDPALQNKAGANQKTHMCLQCRWHIVSGDVKMIEMSRNEFRQKKRQKASSSSGAAVSPAAPSSAFHQRSFSTTSRGAIPPATFMRIKEDELMMLELAENADNPPIKIGEGGMMLEVRWEHDGDQGYKLCTFDAPPDTPLTPLATHIRKKQLIPSHINHMFTCREKVVPTVLHDLFTVSMLHPVLYIRRCPSLPNSNYEYDEPDANYNLVYEEPPQKKKDSQSTDDDPDSQTNPSSGNGTTSAAGAASSSSASSPSISVNTSPQSPATTSNSSAGNNGPVRQIRCATLHKLVEKVTREASTDLELRFVFFLTYPSFCTPTELLERLWSRYNVPEPPGLEHFSKDDIREFRNRVRRIQIRVYSVLKYWMDEYWMDFESRAMRRAMRRLIRDLRTVPSAAEDPENPSQRPLSLKFADDLETLMEKKRGEGLNGLSRTGGSASNIMQNSLMKDEPEEGSEFPPLLMPPNVQVAEIEQRFAQADVKGWEAEFARQLMLVDFGVFSKIHPREFLDNAWSGKSKESKAPNIVRMINHFNKVCCWVQAAVLSSPTPQGRAKLIQSFIKMAEHCGALNNFNSQFAIYCALTANPLHRLKRTNILVKAKSLKRLEAIKVLFQHHGNSRNYRNALRHVTKACTPHLGIFLTDLIYIDDGNPETTLGMINLKKRRLLADRVRWIKQYQQLAPRFRPIPGVQQYFEQHLVAVPEEELWTLSTKVEPRQ